MHLLVSFLFIMENLPGIRYPLNDLSENGFSKETSLIRKYLKYYYTDVNLLAIDRNVQKTIRKINTFHPDVIFNFVESVEGISSYEYCMAGFFELLGYEFTGNIPTCLGNCLNKSRTKNILRSFGIDTPKSMTIKKWKKLHPKIFNLTYPVILKLLL